eukprot:1608438-Rhodomonas_salina.1
MTGAMIRLCRNPILIFKFTFTLVHEHLHHTALLLSLSLSALLLGGARVRATRLSASERVCVGELESRSARVRAAGGEEQDLNQPLRSLQLLSTFSPLSRPLFLLPSYLPPRAPRTLCSALRLVAA